MERRRREKWNCYCWVSSLSQHWHWRSQKCHINLLQTNCATTWKDFGQVWHTGGIDKKSRNVYNLEEMLLIVTCLPLKKCVLHFLPSTSVFLADVTSELEMVCAEFAHFLKQQTWQTLKCHHKCSFCGCSRSSVHLTCPCPSPLVKKKHVLVYFACILGSALI